MKRFFVVQGLRLLAATWRIRLVGTLPSPPAVVAFWHGVMLPVWYMLRQHHPVAMCSASADGDLLAALLHSWGYDVVRGSSSRGGSHALESITYALHAQRLVAITPDGPRGPAREAKAGAFVAAARSSSPVIPVSVHCTMALTLRSWDAFRVPLPFTTITVSIHEPMEIPSDAREHVDAARTTFNTVVN